MTEAEQMQARFAYMPGSFFRKLGTKGADIDGEAANDQSGYAVSMPDSNVLAIRRLSQRWKRKRMQVMYGFIAGMELHGCKKAQTWTVKAQVDGSGSWVSMPGHEYGSHWSPCKFWIRKQQRSNPYIFLESCHRGMDPKRSSTSMAKRRTTGRGSVSMPDSNTVVIGASMNDGNGSNSGHARVFTMCTNTSSSITTNILWPLYFSKRQVYLDDKRNLYRYASEPGWLRQRGLQ
jgi:hypothetical protein